MIALRRFGAALAAASEFAIASAGIQRLLKGEPPTEGAAPWTTADVRRLWALVQLGRPEDVVSGGPPVVIAAGDTWGGRMPMPGERLRADVLHMWRAVAWECGAPLPSPHEIKVTAEPNGKIGSSE